MELFLHEYQRGGAVYLLHFAQFVMQVRQLDPWRVSVGGGGDDVPKTVVGPTEGSTPQPRRQLTYQLITSASRLYD